MHLGVTPATTDPVVATVFATEAHRFGRGVVYIVSANDLTNIAITAGSALATLEAEVAIHVVPLELARRAWMRLDLADAQGILAALGAPTPARIMSLAGISPALRALPRLNQDQIDEFVRMATLLRDER